MPLNPPEVVSIPVLDCRGFDNLHRAEVLLDDDRVLEIDRFVQMPSWQLEDIYNDFYRRTPRWRIGDENFPRGIFKDRGNAYSGGADTRFVMVQVDAGVYGEQPATLYLDRSPDDMGRRNEFHGHTALVKERSATIWVGPVWGREDFFIIIPFKGAVLSIEEEEIAGVVMAFQTSLHPYTY